MPITDHCRAFSVRINVASVSFGWFLIIFVGTVVTFVVFVLVGAAVVVGSAVAFVVIGVAVVVVVGSAVVVVVVIGAAVVVFVGVGAAVVAFVGAAVVVVVGAVVFVVVGAGALCGVVVGVAVMAVQPSSGRSGSQISSQGSVALSQQPQVNGAPLEARVVGMVVSTHSQYSQ